MGNVTSFVLGEVHVVGERRLFHVNSGFVYWNFYLNLWLQSHSSVPFSTHFL